jgi:zinc protease
MTIIRSRFLQAITALGILSAPVTLQTASAQGPAAPATFTLSNGLRVVVIPDRRTPVVTQMIWYKVGSADETPGKSGLAHFSNT